MHPKQAFSLMLFVLMLGSLAHVVLAITEKLGLEHIEQISETSSEYVRGILQVYDDSTEEWLYFCDDDWGNDEAAVACKQLGYADGKMADEAEESAEDKWDHTVNCNGDEESIFDCDNSVDCDAGNVVATIDCLLSNNDGYVELVQKTYPAFNQIEGIVRIQLGGTWHYLCDGIDEDTADWICETLGYDYSIVPTTGNNANGFADHGLKLYNEECDGDGGKDHNPPDDIFECGSWGYDFACDIEENAAGVICLVEKTIDDEYIFLTDKIINEEKGLISGTIEFYSGRSDREWYYVSDENFDIYDADVICKQLFYEKAVDIITNVQPNKDKKLHFDGVLTDLVCSGEDIRISDDGENDSCYGPEDTAIETIAGVTCKMFDKDEKLISVDLLKIEEDGNEITGIVEVYFRNEWSFIEANDWDKADAEVVCKQLGYYSAEEGSSSADTDHDHDHESALNFVDCDGTEDTIFKCANIAYDLSDDSTDYTEEIATVQCYKYNPLHYSDGSSGSPRPAPQSTSTLRLDAYSYPKIDQVEGTVMVTVTHGNEYPICDTGTWNIQDADVVCKELGYVKAVAALNNVDIDRSSATNYWIAGIDCDASDASILDCENFPAGARSDPCDGGDETIAKVICQISEVTLKRTSSPKFNEIKGIVQVNERKNNADSWKLICEDGWDIDDADVVCKEMGYYKALQALSNLNEPQERQEFLMTQVNCDGTESSIKECEYSAYDAITHGCLHENDVAGVVCQISDLEDGTIILTSESNPSFNQIKGTVEIFHNEEWGYVCDNGWEFNEADIVCKQLGYFKAIEAVKGISASSNSQNFWMSDVDCNDKQQKIVDCSFSGWGETKCNLQTNVAGVICQLKHIEDGVVNIIPVDSISTEEGEVGGLVEIYYKHAWHYIETGDHWILENAKVICRQLGYYKAVRIYEDLSAIDSTQKIVDLGDDCVGNEAAISECSITYDDSTATDSELAGILCQISNVDEGSVRLVDQDNDKRGQISGKVQIYHQDEWGYLYFTSNNDWTSETADVVCKQLGYFKAVEHEVIDAPDDALYWMEDIECDLMTSVYLSDCGDFTEGTFESDDLAHLTCQISRVEEGTVMMSDGELDDCELVGTIEIYYGGEWGYICNDDDDDWSDYDANTVCKQMGYFSGTANGDNDAEDDFNYLISNVKCGSMDTSILDCGFTTLEDSTDCPKVGSPPARQPTRASCKIIPDKIYDLKWHSSTSTTITFTWTSLGRSATYSFIRVDNNLMMHTVEMYPEVLSDGSLKFTDYNLDPATSYEYTLIATFTCVEDEIFEETITVCTAPPDFENLESYESKDNMITAMWDGAYIDYIQYSYTIGAASRFTKSPYQMNDQLLMDMTGLLGGTKYDFTLYAKFVCTDDIVLEVESETATGHTDPTGVKEIEFISRGLDFLEFNLTLYHGSANSVRIEKIQQHSGTSILMKSSLQAYEDVDSKYKLRISSLKRFTYYEFRGWIKYLDEFSEKFTIHAVTEKCDSTVATCVCDESKMLDLKHPACDCAADYLSVDPTARCASGCYYTRRRPNPDCLRYDNGNNQWKTCTGTGCYCKTGYVADSHGLCKATCLHDVDPNCVCDDQNQCRCRSSGVINPNTGFCSEVDDKEKDSVLVTQLVLPNAYIASDVEKYACVDLYDSSSCGCVAASALDPSTGRCTAVCRSGDVNCVTSATDLTLCPGNEDDSTCRCKPGFHLTVVDDELTCKVLKSEICDPTLNSNDCVCENPLDINTCACQYGSLLVDGTHDVCEELHVFRMKVNFIKQWISVYDNPKSDEFAKMCREITTKTKKVLIANGKDVKSIKCIKFEPLSLLATLEYVVHSPDNLTTLAVDIKEILYKNASSLRIKSVDISNIQKKSKDNKEGKILQIVRKIFILGCVDVVVILIWIIISITGIIRRRQQAGRRGRNPSPDRLPRPTILSPAVSNSRAQSPSPARLNARPGADDQIVAEPPHSSGRIVFDNPCVGNPSPRYRNSKLHLT